MSSSLEFLTNKLIEQIDTAVEKFNSGIPALQKQIFDDLVNEMQTLDTKGERIATTVENIKQIGKLKARIERVILNPDYQQAVADFARTFKQIAGLQQEYFRQLANNFKTSDVLEALRVNAVEQTVTSLTESGITADITEGVQDILQRNITGGGKFNDLLEQLRNFLTTNETGIGALERYAKQITTDSLNQFSAQYTQAVSDDLGFEWFMYVGSNIKTTRKFCLLLTKKKYIHKSELPDIVRGIIDGQRVGLSSTTGTWPGGIPGTDVSNIQVNRGGYGCGHQLQPVPAEFVPAAIRARFN